MQMTVSFFLYIFISLVLYIQLKTISLIPQQQPYARGGGGGTRDH